MNTLGQQGVLQVMSPSELDKQLAERAKATAAANTPDLNNQDPQQLAGYIKSRYEIFRNHRNTASGWSERLLRALRAFNGQYDASQLAEIKKFGGSDIYARLIAQKCRAASSLLRDIYLSQDRPWAVRPPANPDIPPDIIASIDQLLQHEATQVAQNLGRPPSPADMQQRKMTLMESAEDAAKRKAGKLARESEDRIEDLLREGGYYHALAEFLVDLPVFPFACIKGPVVKVVPTVTWAPGGGAPTVKMVPKLTWNRVSPFDIWFTPGVADIENAEVVEKLRVTRAELNDLLDLPGYNHEEVRAVLDEYGRGGLYDGWDSTDSERAVLESRENPAWNRSAMITMFEYNGNVQGRMLQDYGLAVPDEIRDYHVQVWCIGSHVIKCHLSPSPRQRHPYFVSSYEKVPGTPVGNGLTDLLEDVQQAGNATLRSLVNNLSISSGPQVVVNDDRLSPDESGEQLYPWKRWHVRNDPVGSNSQPPVSFFMPTSNADSLMKTFNELVSIADDVSAIPKYMGGNSASGGAGRTSSGLAMLMGNASKILQTVSANVDRDVIEPSLLYTADLIMLTDTTGLLSGNEKISVLGVNVAVQRETIRQRQLEFLQATMNPTDMKIMGVKGRGAVLRSVSSTLGLNGEQVVPTDEKLDQMQRAEQQAREQQGGNAAEEIEKGVTQGMGAAVKRITTELAAGEIGEMLGMPMAEKGSVGVDGTPSAQVGPPGAKDAAVGQGTRSGGEETRPAQGGPRTNLNAPMQSGTPRLSPGVG